MKKVFDQTVRDLKREVNKKVLKVPGIEQKVLDATSNEPWGPHGTLLADIAHSTRNYNEYHMIMVILWKRISDTGKNWRHVYKGLTVLEYLVANGSERVIDDIKEHAYQISTLSSFQYIDSSGRDQGNNVRRKSQTLVALVNDKEKIAEVRHKAAVNREKFRPAGGMHRPGSYSGSGGYGERYDDDRYGSRGEGRYSYGYDDKYGRDGYRDDDYRGRSRSVDFQYGSRSRSSDRDRSFDDDGQYSSRGSGARAEDTSVDGRGLDRKFSEQNPKSKYSEQTPDAPPSYEEAVGESRSPVHIERDGDAPVCSSPQGFSPPLQSNTVQETAAAVQEFGAVDEFDPRGSSSAPDTLTSAGPTASKNAVPTTSSNSEMDLMESLADPFSRDVMALVPVTAGTASEADSHANSAAAPTFATTTLASNATNQSFEDPFGDGPFKATPSSENSAGSNVASAPPSSGTQFLAQELSASQQDTDILAGILSPSEPSPALASQTKFSAPAGETGLQDANMFGNTLPLMGPTGHVASSTPLAQTEPCIGGPDMAVGSQLNAVVPFGQVTQVPTGTFPFTSQVASQPPIGYAAHFNNGNFLSQQNFASPAPSAHMATHPSYAVSAYASGANFLSQQGAASPVSQMVSQRPAGPGVQNRSNILSNVFSQAGASSSITLQPNISASSVTPVSQPSKDKFVTKSTVWSDTLSRGLVNLNISGPKINPLSNIGVDFDALNRKEKRMEKPTTTSVTSTITMGKAMGSGSGIGRANAGALRPAPNSMMNPGMGMGGPVLGMGMGGGPGVGMGMSIRGGYGGMGQQQMGMYTGMGMELGQGSQMQRPTGLPPGANVPGGYSPMMGPGGYTQQQYGRGYR